jgi:hypothetical protein
LHRARRAQLLCCLATFAGIIGSGQSFASRRLAAQRGIAGWAGEVMGGLSYLDFIRQLVKRVEGDWDSVQARRPLCSRRPQLLALAQSWVDWPFCLSATRTRLCVCLDCAL